jgi:hypothetical protein
VRLVRIQERERRVVSGTAPAVADALALVDERCRSAKSHGTGEGVQPTTIRSLVAGSRAAYTSPMPPAPIGAVIV